MFDWQSFLEKNRVEYSDSGPSTSKGNLYVHCPFCGEADQGRHMGVSIHGRGWGCWRNSAHRGKAPQRLIQALLRCSWAEAAAMAGASGKALTADDSLLGRLQGLLGGNAAPSAPNGPLAMPERFRSLRGLSSNIGYRYLRDERGYSPRQIERLIKRFDLRWSSLSDREWGWRIIIPIYDEERELVTWTGRAVSPQAKLRYKSLTDDPEKAAGGPLARRIISDGFLQTHRSIKGGEFLVLTEGPFDCMTTDLLAYKFGARVECLFTKTISPAQLDTLAAIRSLYRKVFLVLDPEAKIDALRMGSELTALGIEPFLLDGENDPGDMTNKQISRMLGLMENRVARKAI